MVAELLGLVQVESLPHGVHPEVELAIRPVLQRGKLLLPLLEPSPLILTALLPLLLDHLVDEASQFIGLTTGERGQRLPQSLLCEGLFTGGGAGFGPLRPF